MAVPRAWRTERSAFVAPSRASPLSSPCTISKRDATRASPTARAGTMRAFAGPGTNSARPTCCCFVRDPEGHKLEAAVIPP